MTCFCKFPHLSTNSQSPLGEEDAFFLPRVPCLALEIFPQQVFGQGSCWRSSLMDETKSDFNWLILRVANSTLRLSTFAMTWLSRLILKLIVKFTKKVLLSCLLGAQLLLSFKVACGYIVHHDYKVRPKQILLPHL